MVSHDGGNTWTVTAELPGWAQYLNVVGGRFWVVDQVDDQWTILSSSDGIYWKPLYQMPILTQSITDPTRPAGFDQVDGLVMFGRNGVLIGEDSADLRVERTSDGGRTWGRAVNSDLGSPPQFALFDSDRHGWTEEYVLSPADTTGSNGNSVLVTTNDDGSRWSRITSLSPDFVISNVVELRNDVGWVSGTLSGVGALAVTEDGGNRWRFLRFPAQVAPSTDAPVNAFPAPMIVGRGGRSWMLTPNGVWETRNGGASWSLR